ncbi:MAG: TlpA family protein disulfide reductase [Actinomycetota bacterium]
MSRAVPAAAVLAGGLLLAGCAAGGDSPAGLPGPVPDDVSFPEPPATAPPAPDFDLDLLGGEHFEAAAQWSERPLVLVFFESWCEPCGEQQPEINRLAEEYGDAVLFLGIAGLSDEEGVRDYLREHDVVYPVGIDAGGEVWLDYAAEEPPLVALVTKGGRVARGWPGGIDADQLREQIDTVLVTGAG